LIIASFVGMPLEDTPHSVTPEGVAGLAFADEVRTANALVPEIKAKGAESIVLLIHQGGETQNPTLDGLVIQLYLGDTLVPALVGLNLVTPKLGVGSGQRRHWVSRRIWFVRG
jgi:hypothetical protein